jgi:HK97 family phage portal protein
MNLQDAIKTLVPLPEWVAAWEARAGLNNASAYDAYLASAWAARALQLRADAIASVPLRLYDREGDEIEQHPALDLLATVNSEWNAGDLWRYTEMSLGVFGAAYWQKVRAGTKARELFFLNASTMKVDVSVSGITGFTQTVAGNSRQFAREDVVYYRGAYDPLSDLTGLPLLRWADRAAMSEQHADTYLAAFFANGAVPPLVFTTDMNISDTEIGRFTQWWNKLFRRSGNQHKTGIVGGGLKPVQLGSNVKDLALTEVRAEIHRMISTITGVPELLISPTGADLTPVKMAEEILYNTTILPRLTWYGEVLNSELLPEYTDLVNNGAYFEFDTSEVAALQENEDAKASRAKIYFDMGIPVTTALELAGIKLTQEQEAALKKKDAPEPEEQPEDEPADMEEMDEPEPTAPMSEAMNKYMTKAMRLIGKDVDFVHVDVPLETVTAIRSRLPECRSAEDVRRVFADAMRKPAPVQEDSLKALAASIDAAVNAGTKTSGGENVNIIIDQQGNFIKQQATDAGSILNAIKALAEQQPPAPVVNVPAPIVNVAAPVVNVPPAVVNVAAPNVTIKNEVQPADVVLPAMPTEATITTDARTGNKTLKVKRG